MSNARLPTRHMRLGLLGGVAFLATFGSWASLTTLHGAVVTTGELVYTDGGAIDVIHSDGGTVSELYAQSGDFVDAGEPIARMDGALLAVEKRILEDRLFEARLRDWRLQALLDNTPEFPPIPPVLQEALDARPDLARSVARERAAFESTKAEHETYLASVRDSRAEAARAAQAARDIAEGLARELDVITADLDAKRDLKERGLAQRAEISTLERARIQVDNARLQALSEAEAQTARGQTLEHDAQRQDAARRAQMADTLAQTAQSIPELEERLIGITAQEDRLDIRAPVSGHINTLLLASPGVVAMPGTVVATLVPTAQAPHLVAPIAPQQIDQVWEGQPALLRPMTRAQNDLELSAQVVRVGEGVLRDPATGASYYEVVLDPHLDLLQQRGDGLVSGTPFEVAIQTQARSPLAYFLEPIKRSFRRALRE